MCQKLRCTASKHKVMAIVHQLTQHHASSQALQALESARLPSHMSWVRMTGSCQPKTPFCSPMGVLVPLAPIRDRHWIQPVGTCCCVELERLCVTMDAPSHQVMQTYHLISTLKLSMCLDQLAHVETMR
jgi:hypothetical protein